jgi:large conductance mechanosensitive channel
MLKDFKQFILRGNLVDLAVAVVLGVAFAAMISALVKDLITPLIAAIGAKPNFGNLTFTLNGSTFRYGDFIDALLSFLIIAVIVFFLVIVPFNHFLKRVGMAPPEEPTRKPCPECTTEIPEAARRCPACTAVLIPSAPAEPATAER